MNLKEQFKNETDIDIIKSTDIVELQSYGTWLENRIFNMIENIGSIKNLLQDNKNE